MVCGIFQWCFCQVWIIKKRLLLCDTIKSMTVTNYFVSAKGTISSSTCRCCPLSVETLSTSAIIIFNIFLVFIDVVLVHNELSRLISCESSITTLHHWQQQKRKPGRIPLKFVLTIPKWSRGVVTESAIELNQVRICTELDWALWEQCHWTSINILSPAWRG